MHLAIHGHAIGERLNAPVAQLSIVPFEVTGQKKIYTSKCFSSNINFNEQIALGAEVDKVAWDNLMKSIETRPIAQKWLSNQRPFLEALSLIEAYVPDALECAWESIEGIWFNNLPLFIVLTSAYAHAYPVQPPWQLSQYRDIKTLVSLKSKMPSIPLAGYDLKSSLDVAIIQAQIVQKSWPAQTLRKS